MTRDVTSDAANPDKTIPVSADKVVIIDSETAPNSLKEITFANIAAWLATLTATWTNKTLTSPTIVDFTNSTHDHGDADDGGAVISSSATVAGVVELAINAEALTGTDTARAVTAANLNHVLTVLFGPSGTMANLRLSVTVAANDLIVAWKTDAGTDPSASDPGWVKIGNTVRTVTAATSITIVDGTNWFNAGSAELGTLAVGYFAFAVWDSNSTIVALTIARIPSARLVSDFSATTTSEKHCFNYANFTSTDEVENVGYFEAILSLAGTLHLWTVPEFTASNLKQRPTFATNELSFTPVWTNLTITTATVTAKYIIDKNVMDYHVEVVWGASTAITGNVSHTVPFSRASTYGGAVGVISGTLRLQDTGTAAYVGNPVMNFTNTCTYRVLGVGATYATQDALSSTVPFTWVATDEILETARYFI